MGKLRDRSHDRLFQMIYSNQLIYNACWEDPWIDRQLLCLQPDSRVVMITSAGCNALDYLLDGPARIHAVDANPRQNALLELKLSLIERGDYADFFNMFGVGRHASYQAVYQAVQGRLPGYAREFWNRRIDYFDQGKTLRKSFYDHGTSGLLAWCLRMYLFKIKKAAGGLFKELLAATDLCEQKAIYQQIEARLWDRFNSWLVQRPAFMSLAGVPRPQIRLIREKYPGGLGRYIQDKLRHVFTEVPIQSNYFWRVYLTGNYTHACCPNYLKAKHFSSLRDHIHKLKTHNTTLSGFLRENPGKYTHYILLDHQDWMAGHAAEQLREEWRLILENSVPRTRILFRSAGLDHSFLPDMAKSALRFRPELSEPLHCKDRVGTYGSLHFAEVLG